MVNVAVPEAPTIAPKVPGLDELGVLSPMHLDADNKRDEAGTSSGTSSAQPVGQAKFDGYFPTLNDSDVNKISLDPTTSFRAETPPAASPPRPSPSMNDWYNRRKSFKCSLH